MGNFDFQRGILSALGTPEEVAAYDVKAKQRAIGEVVKQSYELSGPTPDQMPVADTGEDPRKLVFSHRKEAEGLRQLGLGAEADLVLERGMRLDSAELKLNKDRANAQVNGLSQALQLATAGNMQGALVTANLGRQPGERITKLEPDGQGNFAVSYENGKSENLSGVQMLKGAQDRATALNAAYNDWNDPQVDLAHGVITQRNNMSGKVDAIAKFTPPDQYAKTNGIQNGKLFIQTVGEVAKRVDMKRMAQAEQSYGKFLDVAQHGFSNPYAQHALIFAYMKVLDPTSTVREGEYATVENTRSVPQDVMVMWNKLIDGDKLAPGQLTRIVGATKALYEAQVATYRNQVHEAALRISGPTGQQAPQVQDYLNSASGATDFSALEAKIADHIKHVDQTRSYTRQEAVAAGNLYHIVSPDGQHERWVSAAGMRHMRDKFKWTIKKSESSKGKTQESMGGGA